MLQNPRSRVAGAALGVLVALSSTSPARAGLVSGVLGGLTHTVGGVAASALPATGGMTLSGPSGTIGGMTPAGGNSFGVAAASASSAFGEAPEPALPRISAGMRATLVAAWRQRISGRVLGVTDRTVRIAAPRGAARTLSISPRLAVALRAYVGKNVALRSVDGSHVAELIGRDDVVRGTVIGIDDGYVGIVSRDGIATVGVLATRDAARLHVGDAVAAVSSDFGTTMQLVALGIPADSTLADTYVGRVASVTNGTATLAIGRRLQTFGTDATIANALRSRVGRVVALDVPDGAHAVALLSTPVISALLHRPKAGTAPVATVVAVAANRLSVQLPNGDLRTLTGPVEALRARAGVTTHLAPLDRTHVRVVVGARAARLADAGLCVTVNASCGARMRGRAASVLPTSISVRLPNGDLRTFVGAVASLGASVGSPVSVQPIDGEHARVIVGARAVDGIDATACVTINSGCRAIAGNVVATGGGSTRVTLPGGSQALLVGSVAGIAVNAPVLLQPLDGSHLVATTSGSLGSTSTVSGCITLDAHCASSGGQRFPIGGPGGPTGPGGGGGGSGPPASGPPGSGPPGSGPPGSGPPTGLPVRGCCGTMTPVDGILLEPGSGLVASAFASTNCGSDGQLIVRATGDDGRAVAGAVVRLVGPFDATVATGTDGAATLLRLPAGAYRMSVQRAGYRGISGAGVTVGCTTAALMKVRLARTGIPSVHASTQARLGRSEAMRAAATSTLCMPGRKGTVCAKPR